MDIKTLREKRAKIVADMHSLTENARTEERDLSKEEADQHDKMFEDQEDINTQIRALERQEKLDREMALQAAQDEENRIAAGDGQENQTTEQQREQREKREVEGFRAFCLGNNSGYTEEFRALQADADLTGGFLVAPLTI